MKIRGRFMSRLHNRFIHLPLLGFALTAGTLALAQDAAEATPPATEAQTLAPVEVQATREQTSSEASKSYKIQKSNSATKLDIEEMETPQTVNVVTRQQIEDFGLTSGRSVLAATPGVTVQAQETERTSYGSRGTEISNFQTDGLGVPFGDYNYQNGDIDTAIYDRIEVLKGANGLTSSLGEPGATVNFIRKRPTKDFQTSLGLSYGSWETKRLEADISGTVTQSPGIRARLVGAAQEGNSYLDHYSLNKNIFSGIIEADLSDSTLLTVGHFEQRSNPEGNNWGALPLLDQSGNQVSYSRSYNPNPEWAKWEKTTKNSFAELSQKLGSDWALKVSYKHIDDKEDAELAYYSGAADQAGVGISVFTGKYDTIQKQDLVDANVTGSYPLFGREHELVVGASLLRSKEASRAGEAQAATDVNWNGWDGTYNISPNYTAYTSYSTIFRPQTTLDTTGKLVDPVDGAAYELGLKSSWFDDRLSATFATFQTQQKHYPMRASDSVGIIKRYLVGELLTQGIELDLQGKIGNSTDIVFGYTQVSMRDNKSGAKTRTYLPTSLVNLLATYQIPALKELKVGASAKWQNKTKQDIESAAYVGGAPIPYAGTIRQGDYALLGLMAHYDVSKNLSVQGNADNVTNKKYLNSFPDGQGFYGAPANYSVGVTLRN
ncbi:MAG: TonB-dependent siderophore receptor [Proteobacteria bacterium]|nr:MAG: TonB-dependent siderophore receptor [Pseudomonadota bacterium]